MIPASHPPDSALRELRVGEFSPVAFNKISLLSISLLLNLSFCVTTAFEKNNLKIIWGILVLIISYELLGWTIHPLEKFPIFGNILLALWYLYGLLQWEAMKYQLLLGSLSVLATMGYFIAEYSRVDLKRLLFYTQMGLFLIPVNLSGNTQPVDLILTCVFFTVCLWTYWFVSWVLYGPFDLEKAFVAISPLLRITGSPFIFYVVVFEMSLFFMFYVQGPSISPTSSPPSSLEENQVFLSPSEEEEEEGVNDEEPPPPPPLPPKKTLPVKTSRFPVLPLVNEKRPIFKTPPLPAPPPSSSLSSPLTFIEERLSGSKLKSLYGV